MSGELLVRVLKYGEYQKALAQGSIGEEIESSLYLDQNNWSLLEDGGNGWVLLDNADFSDAAWYVIDSVCELPTLEGFEYRETWPQLVNEKVLDNWSKTLLEVVSRPNEKPAVVELAKKLYAIVQAVERDSSLRVTVEALL